MCAVIIFALNVISKKVAISALPVVMREGSSVLRRVEVFKKITFYNKYCNFQIIYLNHIQIFFTSFIPCNITWFFLLKTNNLHMKAYKCTPFSHWYALLRESNWFLIITTTLTCLRGLSIYGWWFVFAVLQTRYSTHVISW